MGPGHEVGCRWSTWCQGLPAQCGAAVGVKRAASLPFAVKCLLVLLACCFPVCSWGHFCIRSSSVCPAASCHGSPSSHPQLSPLGLLSWRSRRSSVCVWARWGVSPPCMSASSSPSCCTSEMPPWESSGRLAKVLHPATHARDANGAPGFG